MPVTAIHVYPYISRCAWHSYIPIYFQLCLAQLYTHIFPAVPGTAICPYISCCAWHSYMAIYFQLCLAQLYTHIFPAVPSTAIYPYIFRCAWHSYIPIYFPLCLAQLYIHIYIYYIYILHCPSQHCYQFSLKCTKLVFKKCMYIYLRLK